jgi:putative restriction endonuclease
MRTRTPLIYFNEIRNTMYQAAWPVMIIGDDPSALCVKSVIDPAYRNLRPGMEFDSVKESPLDLRRYITIETRRRLHQTAFRDLVIHAYDGHCTICRLHHPELLDAAHIIGDSEETGIPIIKNGLSLCKIHHAAYDQNILGIDSDYHVHIRKDILLEHDGPMLRHGLQELEGSTIILPRRFGERPDPDRLAERFDQFMTA